MNLVLQKVLILKYFWDREWEFQINELVICFLYLLLVLSLFPKCINYIPVCVMVL